MKVFVFILLAQVSLTDTTNSPTATRPELQCFGGNGVWKSTLGKAGCQQLADVANTIEGVRTVCNSDNSACGLSCSIWGNMLGPWEPSSTNPAEKCEEISAKVTAANKQIKAFSCYDGGKLTSDDGSGRVDVNGA